MIVRPALIAAAVMLVSSPIRGQEAQTPSVLRGVQYLRGQAARLDAGEAALAALAMVKAEVPPNDPGLEAALRRVLSRFSGSSYSPERGAHGGGSASTRRA